MAFTSPVLHGVPIDMTCSWESNNDDKIVRWWYHQTNSVTSEVNFWTFEMNNSTIQTNNAESGFEGMFNFLSYSHVDGFHKVRLLSGTEDHLGVYRCTVTIASTDYQSTRKPLEIDRE